MTSAKLNMTLSGLVLIASTLAVHGQEASRLAAATPIKTERANKFTAACSQRDLLVTTLIERHGESQDVAPETLIEAFFTVMDARKVCARGREQEALALYESVIGISVPARATR
jgi:hypothetical protein